MALFDGKRKKGADNLMEAVVFEQYQETFVDIDMMMDLK